MHARWLVATLACSATALVAPRPALQLRIAAASQEPPPTPTLAAETLSGINVAFSLLSKAVACSAIVGVDPLAGLWSSVALHARVATSHRECMARLIALHHLSKKRHKITNAACVLHECAPSQPGSHKACLASVLQAASSGFCVFV